MPTSAVRTCATSSGDLWEQRRPVSPVTLVLSLSVVSELEGRGVHLVKLNYFFFSPDHLIKAPWVMAVLSQDKQCVRSLG